MRTEYFPGELPDQHDLSRRAAARYAALTAARQRRAAHRRTRDIASVTHPISIGVHLTERRVS